VTLSKVKAEENVGTRYVRKEIKKLKNNVI
jgi:hypothetical protein